MTPCPDHPMGCTCRRLVAARPRTTSPGRGISLPADYPFAVTGVRAAIAAEQAAVTEAQIGPPVEPAAITHTAPEPYASPCGLRGYVHRWLNRGVRP